MKGSPHSAAHLGSQREFWWNPDFLELLGRRVSAAVGRDVRSALDVGAGRCHWTAIVARWFPALERLVASDIEEQWVLGAAKAFADRFGPHAFKVEAVEADVHELPFPDDTFDVTTCQTLLIHVAEPLLALSEMVRVTRPGGVVVVAEPANFRAVLEMDSAALALGLDAQARRMRLWLACRLGRLRLGDPDFDLGERLLPMLQSVGLQSVRVVINDRVRGIAPPYESAEQQSLLAYLATSSAALATPLGRNTVLRLAVAGGMMPQEIDKALEEEATHAALRKSQVQSGRYVASGAPDLFVAWGHR